MRMILVLAIAGRLRDNYERFFHGLPCCSGLGEPSPFLYKVKIAIVNLEL
jgi:hypothetical protein